jgi:hypothetical protein
MTKDQIPPKPEGAGRVCPSCGGTGIDGGGSTTGPQPVEVIVDFSLPTADGDPPVSFHKLLPDPT